jgi:hypothetical protein
MRTRFAWLVLLTISTVHCGGGSSSTTPDAGTETAGDAPRYDVGQDAVIDPVFMDLTKDLPAVDLEVGDLTPEATTDLQDLAAEMADATAPEVDSMDLVELDVLPDVPPPFPFGEECEQDGDCEDGICLHLDVASVCTTTCDQQCPDQWDCWIVDEQEVCVPPAIVYCKPCDPSQGSKMTSAVCADTADGYFNLIKCDDGQCPYGLSCSAEFAASLCVPQSGSCLCLPGEEDKLLDCFIDNEFGICAGSRPCLADSVGQCTGPTPAAEMCNGIDDDCDGLVDEEAGNCTPQFCKQDGANFYVQPAQTCTEGQCVDNPQVSCGLFPCDVVGAYGTCLGGCQNDSECALGSWCDVDGLCYPQLLDGETCGGDSQCQSGNCNKGICCANGDCCFSPTFCPEDYWGIPFCDDKTICQGHRTDAACVNFMCQQGPVVPDDSGCDENTLASECGAYPPAYCSGLEKQSLPVCAGECLSDDNCDPGFHCDYTCKPDLEDGYSCDEDSDCISSHCENGVCCLLGFCCLADGDCQELFASPPVCDDLAACQGSRQDAACVDFVCSSAAGIPDDSACTAATPAQPCGTFADVWCNGEEVQAPSQCQQQCETDNQCDDGYACVLQQCLLKKLDGQSCETHNICDSGHCQNGYCCQDGDCCKVGAECPPQYTIEAFCSDEATCQGIRMDATCQASMCGSIGPIDDDSACGVGTLAQTCAPYPDLMCNGGPAQAPPICASACTEDQQCGAQAHCDDVCKADLPDGFSCDEDSDCASEHCANDFCCGTGDCCGVVADCPDEYFSPPACTNTQQCQGLRVDALCQDFQCTSTPSVSDDSGCTELTLALDCQEYGTRFCNGKASQLAPSCPATCSADSQCAPGYHCDDTCVENLEDGVQCDEDSDCLSGHCANGFCCSQGDCCVVPGDCPADYVVPPVCDVPVSCEGHHTQAVCDGFVCDSIDVDDDSACSLEVQVDDCGPYLPVTCTGEMDQQAPSCPSLCLEDQECDDPAHCDFVCTLDFEDGVACDEPSDCQSGHCANGFCCSAGACCVEAFHCPENYSKPSECSTAAACQGHRVDPVCIGNQCKSVQTDDDSGCNGKILANDCGPNPDIYCSGDPVQPMPVCSASCVEEAECGAGYHCDDICVQDVASGFSCDENTDCQSGHCANGFCCDDGDCCQFNYHCPESYSSPATCDVQATCQGTRYDRTCLDFSCQSMETPDDTACTPQMMADLCGLFEDQFCSGALYQAPPTCLTACSWDFQCDQGNHCDGICTPDLPDAQTCDEASDCQSGYCANGFCCQAGKCCDTASDCPQQFWLDPVCDDSATCQGHRVDPLCETAMCGSVEVDDDSGCVVQTVAAECGLFEPALCNGQGEQQQPPCLEQCTEDDQCDEDAHCDDQCLADLVEGDQCDEDSDCQSGHCANGFCCSQGDCCTVSGDCPGEYSQLPLCISSSNCQGERIDALCEDFVCASLLVEDDSACTEAIESADCGAFLPVYCSSDPEQSKPACPVTCGNDAECDAGAHCDNKCLGDYPDGTPCNEDSDCLSGHCALNVCCAAGDCCITANACPAQYKQYPVCEDDPSCQGHRVDKTCVDNMCGSAEVDDDSGCGWWTVADSCEAYDSVACNGSVDQQAPDCPIFCTSDEQCDSNAHCDETCQEDLLNGVACDEAGDCQSGHCENGYCCSSGDCCSISANCPASYDGQPQCDLLPQCQGTRLEGACQDNRCVAVVVEDDSACTGDEPALDCAPYPSQFCDGLSDQQPPNCAQGCVFDEECVGSAHCDDNQCTADLADGGPCDESSDCQSGHCANGFCCAAGQCCLEALDCPAQFTQAAQCLEGPQCQGQRVDATCGDSMCGSEVVEDDSDCDEFSLVDECGPFPSVHCNGAVDQLAPSCATTCTVDDQCDDAAHCDATCQYDQDNGQPCDEAGDCQSGHCANSFCCEAGDCCAQPADCPAIYTDIPLCSDVESCQGQRGDPVCVDSICSKVTVEDDTACSIQTVAHECGQFADLLCNGEFEQEAQECPEACAGDEECDGAAHCDDVCLADLFNGFVCNESSDCVSNHCLNSFCCAQGDCCAGDLTCPAQYTVVPTCLDLGGCQGTRKDPVCLLNSQCTSVTVADDSGCTEETESNPCGLFTSIYCNGDSVQSAPSCSNVCFTDNDCDPEAHCQNNNCIL